MRTMKWLLAVLMLVSTLAAAVGCQTVKGAGRDVQSIGEAGEDVIDDVRR